MLFVYLTRHAANRRIPVNPKAIAYLDIGADSSIVAFASGETIRVVETPEEILAAIAAAEQVRRPPKPMPAETPPAKKTPPATARKAAA